MVKITEIDRAAAREALRDVRSPNRILDVVEAVARAIADGRERENRGCEVDVLGDSCDVNSRCGHAACQPKHAHAKIIARRRSG